VILGFIRPSQFIRAEVGVAMGTRSFVAHYTPPSAALAKTAQAEDDSRGWLVVATLRMIAVSV
jgi:hypothetical protein